METLPIEIAQIIVLQAGYKSIIAAVSHYWSEISKGMPDSKLTLREEAAANGDLRLLMLINVERKHANVCSIAAAKYGHLHIIEEMYMMYKCGDGLASSIMEAAAKNGHINILEWGKQLRFYLHSSLYVAAKKGQLLVVVWLLKHGNYDNHFALIPDNNLLVAASKHSLASVKWLREKYSIKMADRRLLSESVRRRSISELEWLKRRGIIPDDHLCYTAARTGDIDVMKWICANGAELYSACCSEAFKYGHITMLRWMVDGGCTPNSYCLRRSLKKGDSELAMYLFEHGCEVTKRVCKTAVKLDRADLLELLIRTRHSSVGHICRYAYEYGRKDLLEQAAASS